MSILCEFRAYHALHRTTAKISLKHTGAPVAHLEQLIALNLIIGNVKSHFHFANIIAHHKFSTTDSLMWFVWFCLI